MAAAAILDWRIRKILLADGVWWAQMHHCIKFRHNWSFRCGDIAIVLIFKMTAAAILNFWNCEILLAITCNSSRFFYCHTVFGNRFLQLFHQLNLWLDCSIPAIYKAVFSLFNCMCSCVWFFFIFFTFIVCVCYFCLYWRINVFIGSRGSRCIRMPKFVKIGQSVAKILRFFDF